jgi:hypothetical protein
VAVGLPTAKLRELRRLIELEHELDLQPGNGCRSQGRGRNAPESGAIIGA